MIEIKSRRVNRLTNIQHKLKYNDSLFNKNKFTTNLLEFERFVIKAHFLGSDSLDDYALGKQSNHERIKALFNILILVIFFIRSVILHRFYNTKWLSILFGEVFTGSNRITHSLYMFITSGFCYGLVKILSDYKIFVNNPILAEYWFDFRIMNVRSIFKKKYSNIFYVLIAIYPKIMQFIVNVLVIAHSFVYLFLTYTSYDDKENRHYLMILIFWFILNVKLSIILSRISMSIAIMVISASLVFKFRFKQINDTIRLLSKTKVSHCKLRYDF
jgi:hypothetical protein